MRVARRSNPDGRIVFYFFQTGTWDNGTDFRGQLRYRLPIGAEGASWDADKHLIRYQADAKATARAIETARERAAG